MRKLLIALFLIFLITACSKEEKMNKVTLTTDDNVKLSADFVKGNDKGIILLHMLGVDKSSWETLSKDLNNNGYSVIAIDFRGHGDSDLNYETFTDNDWKNLIKDVKAAASYYLKSNKVKEIYIIGASIGANTAINYAVEDSSVKGVALLSPGMNYRNILVANAIEKYNGKVLLVASKGDDYSYKSVIKLQGINPKAELIVYEGDDHGSDILANNPLEEDLLKWLKK